MWPWPLHRPFLFRIFSPFKTKMFHQKSTAEVGVAFSVAVQNLNYSKNIPQGSPACQWGPCIVRFFFPFFRHLKQNP